MKKLHYSIILIDLFSIVPNVVYAESPEAQILQRLIEKIERLEKQTVPSGAVMAFDLPGGCPIGWSTFRSATGRTIIGVGKDYDVGLDKDASGQPLVPRRYGDHGGEARHTLSIDEIPSHTHQIPADENDDYVRQNQARFHGTVSIGDDKNGPIHNTKAAGGGKPHDIMPPFIALYYCRKD
jgi:hypothetical protein